MSGNSPSFCDGVPGKNYLKKSELPYKQEGLLTSPAGEAVGRGRRCQVMRISYAGQIFPLYLDLGRVYQALRHHGRKMRIVIPMASCKLLPHRQEN